MGAGILPVCLYRGCVYLLLGQERKDLLWSDFGGSTEIKNNRREYPFITAIREGGEELNGILGINKQLEFLVKNNQLTIIKDDNDDYVTFLFKTQYSNDLIKEFDKTNIFAETYLKDKVIEQHNGLFEKVKIEWIKLDDLKKEKYRSKMRQWYLPYLDAIISNEGMLFKELNTFKPYKNTRKNKYNFNNSNSNNFSKKSFYTSNNRLEELV